MRNDAVTPLGYAEPASRVVSAWRTRPLRLALVCWGLPLATGTVVFVAYASVAGTAPLAPASAWVNVGGWVVEIGCILSVVGLVAILIFVSDRWASTAGDQWRLTLGPALLAGALLASNFIVAALMIAFIVGPL